MRNMTLACWGCNKSARVDGCVGCVYAERSSVTISIIGELLDGTERLYSGPSEREALLTAATDWCLCGHYGSVREAFEELEASQLYRIVERED
jgi:hypothetical protein